MISRAKVASLTRYEGRRGFEDQGVQTTVDKTKLQGGFRQHCQCFIGTLNGVSSIKIVTHYVVHLKLIL